jgi:hypothetical protein
MVLSSYSNNIVRFINKDGVELFQIGKDKTGSLTYDTVYAKDTNSVAVSSGGEGKRCITIIDIESKKVMTTISMDTIIDLSTEIPRGSCRTRSSLNSHCVVPCKSQHVTVCVI